MLHVSHFPQSPTKKRSLWPHRLVQVGSVPWVKSVQYHGWNRYRYSCCLECLHKRLSPQSSFGFLPLLTFFFGDLLGHFLNQILFGLFYEALASLLLDLWVNRFAYGTLTSMAILSLDFLNHNSGDVRAREI